MSTDERADIEIDPEVTHQKFMAFAKALDDMIEPDVSAITNVLQDQGLPVLRRMMEETHAALFFIREQRNAIEQFAEGGVEEGIAPEDAEVILAALKAAMSFADEVKRMPSVGDLVGAKATKMTRLCEEAVGLVNELVLDDDEDDEDDAG